MTDQVLKLEKAPGFLRKISINVINKDAAYTLFTLPIEGIPMSEAQLDEFMGEYTFRSWYEQRKDQSWHPMPWWSKRDKGNFELDAGFVCKAVTVTIEGTDYRFDEYCIDEESDEDEEDEDMRPAGRISSVKLTPTPGGTTQLSFHLQVRALAGKARDQLLDHMYRHIAVTFDDASVAAKKVKQQALPLVVADQTGHKSPPPIVSRGGEDIDAEMRGRHPEAADEVMGADAHSEPDALNVTGDDAAPAAAAEPGPTLEEDTARFEEGARKNLENFTAVSTTGAIDGTTTRSRRRRRSEDTAH
jgi:hypothetical protein